VPVTDYDVMWREVYGEIQDRGPVHRHMRRLLRRLLAELDYRSALDVGCGAGHNLPLLTEERRLERLVGVDLVEEPLSRARRRADGEFRRLDVESEALDERFELVFTSLLLEHLPDDVAALRNLRAMAERHLVATTIAGDFERYRRFDEQVGHVRNYRRGELEDKLADAGFRVRRAVYWGFPFYSPLVRTVQNRTRPSALQGPAARAAAAALYGLYFLNSVRRGDLLIVHATT
jgi:trans-aconitate methyltransferase